MKAYKQLASQTIVYGMGTIVPRLLNYLLTPLYTYILLESSFGIITEMYSYIAFFMVILTLGMETSFFRFSTAENDHQSVFSNAFLSLFTISTIFLGLVFLNVTNLSLLLGGSHYKIYIVLTALIIYFDVLVAIPLAKLRLENKAFKFSLIRIGNILINIIFNIFFFVICRGSEIEFLNNLYHEEFGVGYAFLSNLIASLFNFVVLLPVIFKSKFSFNKSLFVNMMKYSWPLIIVGVAGMVNEVSDKLFIKYLTPTDQNPMQQVGIYGANYKLAILMTIFIQVFKYAAEPFFFKQYGEDNAKTVYARVMNFFIAFCLVIFLGVSLNIEIFKFFIGESYRVGLNIVPVILMANLFLGVYFNLSIWYKLKNLTKYGALISIIGAIITIVLNIIFIPIYGYYSAAWVTFICYFLMMLLSYFIGQRFYHVQYNLKKIGLYFGVALVFFFVNQQLHIQNVIFNLLYSMLAISVFLFVFLKGEGINSTLILKFIKRQ